LAHTADFLSSPDAASLLEIDENFISVVKREQDGVKEELIELRARAVRLKQELEEIWREDNAAAYELTSVFIHRGSSPSWGHYFFYSRHLPHRPDMWFKYNDSEVTTVSKEEVLADTTSSTTNPYLVSVVFVLFPPRLPNRSSSACVREERF
jgi:ubiquitin carboxyl-terminal hydrolase 25/28